MTRQPLDHSAYEPSCAAFGDTLEDAAEEAGIELEGATRADGKELSYALGRMLARKRPESIADSVEVRHAPKA